MKIRGRSRLPSDAPILPPLEGTMKTCDTMNVSPILGTWKLQALVFEATATGRRSSPFGDHPDGYLSYSPDGRMYAIGVAEDRPKPCERDTGPASCSSGRKTVLFHCLPVSWQQTTSPRLSKNRYAASLTISGGISRLHAQLPGAATNQSALREIGAIILCLVAHGKQ